MNEWLTFCNWVLTLGLSFVTDDENREILDDTNFIIERTGRRKGEKKIRKHILKNNIIPGLNSG